MAKPIKVACIVGTRPEAIKMAPVVRDLKARDGFEVFLLSTGQHKEMLAQVLAAFDLTPDHDLEIMTERQTLNQILARAIPGLDQVFAQFQPNLVLVQGDTSTAFIAGLVAFNRRIKVGHVEAGLRSGDKWQPFPEEVNRRLLSVVADLNFAPTPTARDYLLREAVDPGSIFVTGNTVIDALLTVIKPDYRFRESLLEEALQEHGVKRILVTAHRRENWGEPMAEICQAAKSLLASGLPLRFIWPVHLNPVVREVVHRELSGVSGVYLTDPLEYSDLANLMSRVDLIWTDSGGIQEEAPSLGVPILVLREVTERPEGVAAKAARLVGTEAGRLVQVTRTILTQSDEYRRMAAAANPYGDGAASRRIGEYLAWYYGLISEKPLPFA
ncbi:MAG: UDP-N-acetylglucosamine 2-epimerase (non-hydrolyzing) [Firmicutes bacterium]|nr:UDP-N-acetylglucosamine 2-epimerase (non-hydrolyzing) [Bacillota bacterium]